MKTLDEATKWLIKNSNSELRIDCDYGSSGLWSNQGENFPRNLLEFSPELSNRIAAWQKDFDDTLIFNNFEAGESWWDAHFVERNSIALELQQVFGEPINVVVWDGHSWKSVK